MALYFTYIQILVVVSKMGKRTKPLVMLFDVLMESRFVVVVGCLLMGSTQIMQLWPCVVLNVVVFLVWLAATIKGAKFTWQRQVYYGAELITLLALELNLIFTKHLPSQSAIATLVLISILLLIYVLELFYEAVKGVKLIFKSFK